MCILYHGGLAMGGVIVLLLVTEARKLESTVLKPAVPRFCQSLCHQTVGQCIYTASDLSCHIITHRPVSWSSAKRRQISKAAKYISRRYAENNMRCPSDEFFMTNGSDINHLQGRKLAKPSSKGPKKKSCVGKGCKASDTSTSLGKDCILFLRENITIDSKKQLIALPLTVKPGMKISVYGGFVNGTTYSQLTFTKDPKHPTNIMKWIHVMPIWTRKYMVITRGFERKDCTDVNFPISDETHFNVTLKLSSSTTKIYANQALVWTMEGIPYIRELLVRRYGKVYRLVVQKTEDGCDEVDNGIP